MLPDFERVDWIGEYWGNLKARDFAHTHEDNDDVFFVLEGRPDLLVGEEWVSLDRGGFVLVPRGVSHDFRNTTGEEAGLLNLFIPGGFERDMPEIVKWFEEHR
jgi:mannose-6-phosphate isomerase-like protein (cupin superfamily)